MYTCIYRYIDCTVREQPLATPTESPQRNDNPVQPEINKSTKCLLKCFLSSFFFTFYFVLGCINAVIVSGQQQRGLKKCYFLS